MIETFSAMWQNAGASERENNIVGLMGMFMSRSHLSV